MNIVQIQNHDAEIDAIQAGILRWLHEHAANATLLAELFAVRGKS
jgi:hypothetical protein